MKIIFLGAPGSGKSTQAKLLANKLQVPHFSSGQMYRDLSRQSTAQGQRIKAILARGDLVPDEETITLVKQRLADKIYQAGFVLDGIPRNLWQAQNFDLQVDKVIYLGVSDQENVKRLSLRGRLDDELTVIKNRLQVYHQQTEPILQFYRQKGILIEVDGDRPVEVIFADICRRLL